MDAASIYNFLLVCILLPQCLHWCVLAFLGCDAMLMQLRNVLGWCGGGGSGIHILERNSD